MKKENNKNILILNGSIRGMTGNSGKIVLQALSYLNRLEDVSATTLTLTDEMQTIDEVRALLTRQDGFFIVTGNYWNSYGSPLQRFIEVMTPFEHTPCFFGKPVACAVSMDSVGGMDIAARMHAVFSGLGCWSPPCATIVLSRVGLEAIAASRNQADDRNEDVWRPDDLDIILHNLVLASGIKPDWSSWPFKKLKVEGLWPQHGILDMGSPKFL